MSAKAKTVDPVDDPFFTFAQAARYMGASERWVRGQHMEGNLPSTKMGRLVRFRKSHLDKYIAENTNLSDGE